MEASRSDMLTRHSEATTLTVSVSNTQDMLLLLANNSLVIVLARYQEGGLPEIEAEISEKLRNV